MAKKKLKKDEGEEEEEQFGPPPFDEKAFYTGELHTSKATIVAALWGLVIAVVSTGVYAATMDFTFGLAAGVAAALVLKPLLDRLGVATADWGVSKWAGAGFSYFATWLSLWILFVNPPIMDLSPPVLKDQTPSIQELGSRIRLDISAVDNTEVTSLSATITRPDRTEQTSAEFILETGHLYRLELGDINATATGTYLYRVRAEDPSGHSTVLAGSLRVVEPEPPVITLIAPSNGSEIAIDQAIRVDITDNSKVASVHYFLDNGTDRVLLKMGKSYQSYTHVYYIRPNTSGHQWTGGSHWVTVVATDMAGLANTTSYSFTLR
jgi:hypothetical protein